MLNVKVPTQNQQATDQYEPKNNELIINLLASYSYNKQKSILEYNLICKFLLKSYTLKNRLNYNFISYMHKLKSFNSCGKSPK